MKKEVDSIVRLFNKHKPKTVEELLEITLDPEKHDSKPGIINLQLAGFGSFRKVYRINNLPLLVKFSIGPDANREDCLDHTINEVDAILKVEGNPIYKPLRKYLPEIYYFNEKDGVILVKEYTDVKKKGNLKLKRLASEEIERIMKKAIDFHKNFVVDSTGNVTLLDWGLLGDVTNWYEE